MIGPTGMLLDRGLTLAQLDLALSVARSDTDPDTNRRKLTIALRDVVSEQEAQGKTKKCLTRVWLSPPPPAAPMIAWARDADWAAELRAFVHYAALLATFPFVGVVARSIGQRLQVDGYALAQDVRSDVKRRVGDRSSVEVAARKSYTTMVNLGLLTKDGQTLRPTTGDVALPDALAEWCAHAVMLTRQAESLQASSVANAPELLLRALPPSSRRSYPLIDRHATTNGAVLVGAHCARP
jgi:hypothetical protein